MAVAHVTAADRIWKSTAT